DGIRDRNVTGVQTCALPIFTAGGPENQSSGNRPANQPSNVALFCFSVMQALHHYSRADCKIARIERSSRRDDAADRGDGGGIIRSEERRVGKERRARWWMEQ